MHVNVNFTLNINAAEWEGRKTGVADRTVDINDPDTVQRIWTGVRAHAENVVRDLYADMGWTVEENRCKPGDHKFTRNICDNCGVNFLSSSNA